jgi:hypothetical protein
VTRPLRAAVAAVPEGAEEQHARLLCWLDAHPHWADTGMSSMGRWTEVVQRFTFTRPGP